MLLAQRNPSLNWEPVPLDPSGQQVAWVWIRPAVIPAGLMFALPATLFVQPAIQPRLTVRQLVAASGLDPSQILAWTVDGQSFDALGGTSPNLDQILSPHTDGSHLEISVWMIPWTQTAWPAGPAAQAVYPQQQPAYTATGCSNEDWQMLDAIDSCWNGVLQLEARVGSVRKELTSSISRLNSINRDLNTDERRFCDSSDLQDWSDARRWLRDSTLTLSKSLKEIDTGTTSGAGRRHTFDDIYRNHVLPKVPFPGLAQAANEFETYRKILQSVLASATASLSRAGREAESRANAVLQRINAKVRSRRRKT